MLMVMENVGVDLYSPLFEEHAASQLQDGLTQGSVESPVPVIKKGCLPPPMLEAQYVHHQSPLHQNHLLLYCRSWWSQRGRGHRGPTPPPRSIPRVPHGPQREVAARKSPPWFQKEKPCQWLGWCGTGGHHPQKNPWSAGGELVPGLVPKPVAPLSQVQEAPQEHQNH